MFVLLRNKVHMRRLINWLGVYFRVYLLRRGWLRCWLCGDIIDEGPHIRPYCLHGMRNRTLQEDFMTHPIRDTYFSKGLTHVVTPRKRVAVGVGAQA